MANPVEGYFNRALQSIDPNHPDAEYLTRNTRLIMEIMQSSRNTRLSCMNQTSRQLVEAAEDEIGEKLGLLVAVPELPTIAYKILEKAEMLEIPNLELCYLPEIDFNIVNLPQKYQKAVSSGISDPSDDSEEVDGYIAWAMKKGLIKSTVKPGWRLFDSRAGAVLHETFQSYPQDENFLQPVLHSVRSKGLVNLAPVDFRMTDEDRFTTRTGLTPDQIKNHILPLANVQLGLFKQDTFFDLPSIAELNLINNIRPDLLKEIINFEYSSVAEWCSDPQSKQMDSWGLTSCHHIKGGPCLLFSQNLLALSATCGFRLIGNFATLT